MNESLVYLRDVSSGQSVDASLFDEVSDEHLRLWENDWVHCRPIDWTQRAGSLDFTRL